MEKCDVGKIISKHVPEFSMRYQGIFDLSSKKYIILHCYMF